MVSSKIFTSVLVCGSVKQPCNPEPKGHSPGSRRAILATTGTNPSTAAATRRLPVFVGARVSSCSSCWTKQEQGAGGNGDTLPPAATGRTGERSHSWWDAHTAWGLLREVFLFVPFNATGNPRKGSHPSTGEALPLNHANTASLT